MANLVQHWRTNRFKVKNIEAFLEDISDIDYRHEIFDNNEIVLLDSGDGESSYDLFYDDNNNISHVNWVYIAKTHLEIGEVIIFQLVGNEKLRYLVGYSEAFTYDGKKYAVNLDDIYIQLGDAGYIDVKPCEY